ncbi:MAG: MlaD family protein [Acidimicrobiales bacterium]|nr:MlaD family protein [Acidimicrobiales bacterium]
MGLWIKLGVLTMVGIASLAALAIEIGQLDGPAGAFADTYPVTARFDDATGLTNGDEIRLAGVRIGKVGSIEVDRGEAIVKMNIDERYDVPEGSRFELTWKNLLGQRFILVVPPDGAAPDGPAIEEGIELASSQTRSAADLSMLLNNTEPLLAQLDVPKLNRVTATLADAISGRETVLAQGITDAESLLTQLVTRRDAIDRSLVNLDTLIGGIAGRDEEVERFLIAFATTAETLGANAGELGLAVEQLDTLVSVADEVLQANADELDTVIDQSIAILDTVVANADALEEGLHTLPWATAAVTRVTGHGDWFQVYARGVGIVNTEFNEPVIGNDDYNDTGVDDQTAPQPLLGEPRVPTPPIPETGVGPITLNPSDQTRAQSGSSSSGLSTLLSNLLGGGS